MSPFEAGLKSLVDFDKGDFVGRDALLQLDQRQLLLGLTCKTAVPGSGNLVFCDSDAVGRITAGVPSPTLGVGIGYVRFFKPDDWIGSVLTIQLADGALHRCNIVEFPFFDKQKDIVKGIDRKIPERNMAELPS